MHVKMTRIESGVTVPKGLFTFYVNVKIVTAKIMTDIQNFCDRNSVMHTKNQNATSNFF
jgi:hypothetical protein